MLNNNLIVGEYVIKPKKVDAEDTKEKICEAQYFLDRMIADKNEPNPFKYNLSAFLFAFRSIRDFMDKELKSTKLDACCEKIANWMDNNAEIRLLREERNVTTHERIVLMHNDVIVHVPTAGSRDAAWAEYTWRFAPSNEIRNIHNIQAILQRPIIDICQSCLKDLLRQISSCDQGLVKPLC